MKVLSLRECQCLIVNLQLTQQILNCVAPTFIIFPVSIQNTHAVSVASVLNHNTQATNEHDFYLTLLLSGDNKSSSC